MSWAGRQNCSDHADEATRLAKRAATAEEREAYERIAAVWRHLAEADAMAEEARGGAARD